MPNCTAYGEENSVAILRIDFNNRLSKVQKTNRLSWKYRCYFCIMDAREMKKAFEMIDHTADIGIIVYGTDVKELFSNAALALFSLITEPDCIQDKLHLNLKVSSEGTDTLLVEWLNELIYFFDTKHLLFNRCDIESLTDDELNATCYGEGFDPMKHKIKRGIKAATYHMLKLDKNEDGYKAQVIFDI